MQTIDVHAACCLPGTRRRVADIATEYGLADGKQWMRNWETEWQATLDECNPDGSCIVNPN